METVRRQRRIGTGPPAPALIAWVQGGGMDLAVAGAGWPGTARHAADPTFRARDITTATAIACATLLVTAAISSESLTADGQLLGDKILDLLPGVGSGSTSERTAEIGATTPLADLTAPGLPTGPDGIAAVGSSGFSWTGLFGGLGSSSAGGVSGGLVPGGGQPVEPSFASAAPIVGSVAQPLAAVVAPVSTVLGPVSENIVEPVLETAAPVVHTLDPVLRAAVPVVRAADPVVAAVAPLVDAAQPLAEAASPVVSTLQPVTTPLLNPLGPTVNGVAKTLGLVP